MSDAAVYKRHADELLRLALQTTDVIERGRMLSLAAHWHMRAAEIEKGVFPSAEDFALDSLDFPDDDELSAEGDEA